MHGPARFGRSLHRIGDRSDLHLLHGFAGAVNLHELDRIARSDLHDIALPGVAERLGELARKGREGQFAHLASVGGRRVVNRILRGGSGEIGPAAKRRQQAVGQLLLGIGQYDMAHADRVGSHLRRQHAGHRPLVVLQHGAVGLPGHQRLGLLLGELGGRHVVVGDLAVTVAADERLEFFGDGELLADFRDLLLEVQQVVVRRSDLEHDIGDRARRQLPEQVLMAVVVGPQIGIRNVEQRIGNLRILLAGPLARIGVVGRLDAARHFERIDVHAAPDQSEELLHLALHAGLLVELRPRLRRLGIGLGLRQEIGDGGHVVGTRAGIGKGVEEGLRRLLAAGHRHPFGLRHAQTQPLEPGREHVAGDERLPRGVGQHRRLLFIALLGAALALDLLVLVVILRIIDLLAADHTDPRIVARETHLGFQREDECQEGKGDDDREHDAELGT